VLGRPSDPPPLYEDIGDQNRPASAQQQAVGALMYRLRLRDV